MNELKIDELLQNLKQGRSFYEKYPNVPLDDQVLETKDQLYSLMMEVIGEDDIEVRGTTQSPTNPKYWTKRTTNRYGLRFEQRTKLNHLFGKE